MCCRNKRKWTFYRSLFHSPPIIRDFSVWIRNVIRTGSRKTVRQRAQISSSISSATLAETFKRVEIRQRLLNIGNVQLRTEFNSRTIHTNEEWNGNWQQATRLQALKLANRAICSISANSKSWWNFQVDDDKIRERERETRFRALFFSRRRGGLWYLVSTAGNVSNERGNDLAVIFRFSTAKHVETTEAIAPK